MEDVLAASVVEGNDGGRVASNGVAKECLLAGNRLGDHAGRHLGEVVPLQAPA